MNWDIMSSPKAEIHTAHITGFIIISYYQSVIIDEIGPLIIPTFFFFPYYFSEKECYNYTASHEII